MSLGFLLEKEQPAIMRGPLIAGILKQFMEQVAWGDLDLMIVDMPPGTGDAQLSLVQTVDLDGAVMVTTPQKVATGDVRRGMSLVVGAFKEGREVAREVDAVGKRGAATVPTAAPGSAG